MGVSAITLHQLTRHLTESDAVSPPLRARGTMARMTTPAEDTLTALIHLLDREGYDAQMRATAARAAQRSKEQA